MEKKYQFFISSTYEDLREEREKAIFTILSMEQFPVGMELFSAADDDQWEVISQTIDTTDYYVLIIGNRYGSIIPEGEPDAGISYTEKEFNYAVGKHIPILAFLMDESIAASKGSTETPDVVAKLYEFKKKVKTGRFVKFFKNSDELSTLLSQSIFKAMRRGDRPGWVRATDFSIEESHARILQLTDRVHVLESLNADLKLENNRRPELSIMYRCDPEVLSDDRIAGSRVEIEDGIVKFKVKRVYMEDAKGGITYNDAFGHEINVDENDVRLLRYFFQNGFQLLFHITNEGTTRATGVRIHMEIPNGLLVISMQEIWDYVREVIINCTEEEYEGRMDVIYAPYEYDDTDEEDGVAGDNVFISMDELIVNEDISDLLDPSELDVSAGEINLEFDEVRHKDAQFYRGAYLLPTTHGEFEIRCTIICNEMADKVEQTIKVVVE